jgi:hypothetical protein
VLSVRANQQIIIIYRRALIENEYKILIGQHEGRVQNGRPRHRCEDKSELDLRGIKCESVDWIHVAHHRIQRGTVVNIFMMFRVF